MATPVAATRAARGRHQSRSGQARDRYGGAGEGRKDRADKEKLEREKAEEGRKARKDAEEKAKVKLEVERKWLEGQKPRR